MHAHSSALAHTVSSLNETQCMVPISGLHSQYWACGLQEQSLLKRLHSNLPLGPFSNKPMEHTKLPKSYPWLLGKIIESAIKKIKNIGKS